MQDVHVEKIRRPVGRGNPTRRYTDDEVKRIGFSTVDCFSVVLVRDEGEQIHLAETTDRSVADAIQGIIQDALTRS